MENKISSNASYMHIYNAYEAPSLYICMLMKHFNNVIYVFHSLIVYIHFNLKNKIYFLLDENIFRNSTISRGHLRRHQ